MPLPDKVVAPRLPRDIYRRWQKKARLEGRSVYALVRETLIREGLKLPPAPEEEIVEDEPSLDPPGSAKLRFAG